jgi:hypothetical protein
MTDAKLPKDFYFCCMSFKNLLFILILAGNCVNAQYSPEDEMPPIARAHDCMNKGNYRMAEGIYREELRRNNVSGVQQLLCHSLLMQQKFAEADSTLLSLVALDSNAEQNYWFLALSAERQSNDDKTLFLFKKYIAKAKQRIENSHGVESENPKAWLKMGSVFRRKMHTKGINDQEWIEMVYDYEVYLRLNPTDQFAFNLREFLDQVRIKRPDPMGGILLWDEKS